MSIGCSRPLLGGNPDRFHDFFSGSTLSQRRLSFDAVRALRHMRDGNGDDLLRFGGKRSVCKYLLVESLKGGVSFRRGPRKRLPVIVTLAGTSCLSSSIPEPRKLFRSVDLGIHEGGSKRL
jgi:hypothetical protein